MPSILKRRSLAAFAAFAALVSSAQLSASINVQPVIIDLETTGRKASGIVTLQNTFADAIPVEVTVHPVRVVNGELAEMDKEEAENILVFPTQAVVETGGTQAFRIQWVGEPSPAASEHYYVTVAQLPVALSGDVNAIQVLHRFRILVNIGTRGDGAELTVESVEIIDDDTGQPQPRAVISNRGANYGYVAQHRMTVSQTDENGQYIMRETFQPEQIQQLLGLGMVPSGASRTLPIGLDLPSADGRVSIQLTPADSD